MVLVTCKRIPVITKVQRTALTLIIILSLVMAHPQDREVTLRTGPARVMEKHTITQVRMPCARFYVLHVDTFQELLVAWVLQLAMHYLSSCDNELGLERPKRMPLSSLR